MDLPQSHRAAIPDDYRALTEAAIAEAIEARRRALGRDVLILAHHYQRDEVIRHADLIGDSLKLSRLAAEETRRRGSRSVVFCGVSFMAETADILTPDDVDVILPSPTAACPMAAMADEDDVTECWRALQEIVPEDLTRILPIAYVNSSAAVKAFAGLHGGTCCTSSNAVEAMQWALAGGEGGGGRGPVKVLFLPDEHLGRNTAAALGIAAACGSAGRGCGETAVWQPRRERGGLSDDHVRAARVILWQGHCYVHQRFRPEHVQAARQRFAECGGVTVIVHPECAREVVDLSDETGSTERIIRRVESARPGSNWVIGTEAHLVHRLARQAAARGVRVEILGGRPLMCAQMFRIGPPALLWVLDNLAEGHVVNRVRVEPHTRRWARVAVERMLRLSGSAEVRSRTAPHR